MEQIMIANGRADLMKMATVVASMSIMACIAATNVMPRMKPQITAIPHDGPGLTNFRDVRLHNAWPVALNAVVICVDETGFREVSRTPVRVPAADSMELRIGFLKDGIYTCYLE
jgi:hypothetical protein